MKTALEQCREAFPDFDDVPECLEKAHTAGLIKCVAWHNDACPSFEAVGKPRVRLFVDYSAPEKRELPRECQRFFVMRDDHDEPCHKGDDAEAALAVLLREQRKSDEAEIQATIDRVALHFVTDLLKHIGAEKMLEVARLNRAETNQYACHTHDFVDANEVMAAAFKGVTGREILDAVQAQYAAGTEFEHDDKIWSAAWKKAREMIQQRFPE
jgi:hypothetical protein